MVITPSLILLVKKAVAKRCPFFNPEEKEDCVQSILLRIHEKGKVRNLKWMILDYMSENGMSSWRAGKRSAIPMWSKRFLGELSDVQEKGYEITDDLHSIDLKKILSVCDPKHRVILAALGRDFRQVEIAEEYEVTEAMIGQSVRDAIHHARKRIKCLR